MMSTSKPISIRRPNRDYTTHVDWTYELKSDLYKLYVTSRTPSAQGYTVRLKKLWDEKHPDIPVTSKNLSTTAKRIISEKLIFIPEATPKNPEADGTPTDNLPTEELSEEVPESISSIPNMEINTESATQLIVQDVETTFSETYDETLAKLRPIWKEQLEKLRGFEIHKRPYQTKVRKKPTEIEIKAVNQLASEYRCESFEDINMLVYVSAVTIQTHLDDLKEHKRPGRKPKKPGWITNLETKVEQLRRKISFVTVMMECQNKNQFTRHQMNLKRKLQKWFGNTKPKTLNYRLLKLKQELKATSSELKYKTTLHKRTQINNKFAYDQKSVYRSFKGDTIEIERPPPEAEVESFWKDIWNHKTDFNRNAGWLDELKSEYCINATQKEYTIDNVVLEQVLHKLPNSKSPGPDLITGFWYKNLTFYHNNLILLFEKSKNGEIDLPQWLTTARTILLPKNTDTHIAKNYRPIACLNIMYKMYTSCLQAFLTDHCESNNIITIEQAAGKNGVWGCIEQLLINKTIQDEVVNHRRNLVMVWLDYQKAFDSISHDWLIESLRLAKVPETIVRAVEGLTKSWATQLHLTSNKETTTSDLIEYLKGVFQGDGLSLLLFVLALNPLSFLLQKQQGYKMGDPESRNLNISHLFFVDDLKLYGTNILQIQAQLDLITQFSQDIGMKFGEGKCAYAVIKRGKLVNTETILTMNGLNIKPIKPGENYTYLGQDESVQYNGPLNKERVTKEYFKRIRNIWSSELSAYHKYIAHNTFAVPVIIPTFGLLDWTLQELRDIDIKTRKLLCITGNFNINGDVDRLYIPRKDGGRGLKSIITAFETRIISLAQHLQHQRENNPYLENVHQHERDNICRIAKELIEKFSVEIKEGSTPRSVSQEYLRHKQAEHAKLFTEKVAHGYLRRKTYSQSGINQKASLSWSTDKYITSHFEGYVHAIQEQEIPTKYLMHKRLVSSGMTPTFNNKCRLCKSHVEDISHIIAGCPKMSSRFYLPLRHDVVAKTIWNELRGKNSFGITEEEFIETEGQQEFWWNLKIKTGSKLKHNRPDIVAWDHQKKDCKVIEVSCPLDVNVVTKTSEKENIYGRLLRNLQMMYPDYKFQFIPIIVGATGYVPDSLADGLEELGFSESMIKRVTHKIQMNSVSGTVKIAKTFTKFKIR